MFNERRPTGFDRRSPRMQKKPPARDALNSTHAVSTTGRLSLFGGGGKFRI
jgi:hypothetical protein